MNSFIYIEKRGESNGNNFLLIRKKNIKKEQFSQRTTLVVMCQQ